MNQNKKHFCKHKKYFCHCGGLKAALQGKEGQICSAFYPYPQLVALPRPIGRG